ncbi:mediator of RNA polymerase II transcription subunit 22A-like protein [Tanacetum coccineum]
MRIMFTIAHLLTALFCVNGGKQHIEFYDDQSTSRWRHEWGSDPTAAVAAMTAQKQKLLQQSVDNDTGSIIDSISSVNVDRGGWSERITAATVNDPLVRNSQEAFMLEVQAARMVIVGIEYFLGNFCDKQQVQEADSMLKLVLELKQTTIFSGFASLNDHVDKRTAEPQAEKTDRVLAKIGEEDGASIILQRYECGLPIIIMAQQQQIIPTDQLISIGYQSIRRCNNYTVLQSIPCLPNYKIVEQILVDHPLSYALTITVDIPVVYLQQFWNIVRKWKLLTNSYTIGNVTVRGMLILNESITNDIRATEKYKEYEKVFVQVDVPTIQPQLVESTQGTNRTPSAHRIRTPTTIAQKKRKNVAGETSLLSVQIWARLGFKGIEEFLL